MVIHQLNVQDVETLMCLILKLNRLKQHQVREQSQSVKLAAESAFIDALLLCSHAKMAKPMLSEQRKKVWVERIYYDT